MICGGLKSGLGWHMVQLKICDIKEGMRNVEVTGRIVGRGERKRVQTRFGFADVATATLEDETGSIRINLWRDQIDAAREGRYVTVINGFVRVYGDRMELNVGKDGKVVAVEEPS